MRSLVLLLPLVAMPLVAIGPVAAVAANPTSTQASNIDSQDTRSEIAPALPSPDLAAGEKPTDYLRAAQGALAAGRDGEAQEALEMAQTRVLDRSVPLGQTGIPSDNPTVGQISQALRALAARDRAGCAQLIQTAMSSAAAQGL